MEHLTFAEWVEKETGQSLKELDSNEEQRHRLYEDYEEYCKNNFVEPVWTF